MKLYFEAYGCTLNRGEAQIMQDVVEKNEHEIVDSIEKSDLLVLVTCTVIETTERKMLKRLKAFKNADKPTIVGGCMATAQPQRIFDCYPQARLLRPQDYLKINPLINDMVKGLKGNGMEKEKEKMEISKVDAIIPIATGCDGNCTYCITRIARGDLTSTPPKKLVENARNALDNGFKELRITSQDNAIYGNDIDYSLPRLLGDVVELQGDFRVRVGMMNPNSLSPIIDDLIEIYQNEKIYKFLHLPVQSGDDEVLQRMGRKYRVDDFTRTLRKFRTAFPGLTLSTDIIVGFPGEGEAEFQKSVELVETIRPDILNITRFSARPGTEAERMVGKIPGWRAKERSRLLTKAHERISLDINMSHIGETRKVLITKHGKNRTVFGRDGSYKPVVFKENLQIGEFVEAKIIDASGVHLIGERV